MKFDNSKIKYFCINLERSTERKNLSGWQFAIRNMQVEFWKATDKLQITKPENVKLSIGEYACYLSQLSIIKHAKENNIPAVLIMEDDVAVCTDWQTRIKYLESLTDFDFDILHLGGHFRAVETMTEDTEPTKWKYIYKTKFIVGCYSYLITSKVYDYLIDNADFSQPWDNHVSSAVTKFNGYAIMPFMATCRPCISDINDRYMDYSERTSQYFKDVMEELKPIEKPQSTKCNLQNVCFIIPFMYDTQERLENLTFVVRYINKHFDTHIVVVDSSPDKFYASLIAEEYRSVENVVALYKPMGQFLHRTRMVNDILKCIINHPDFKDTPYVCINDCDAFFNPEQYIKSVEMLQNGYSMVYPYAGNFMDIPRTIILDGEIRNPYLVNPKSVGGAVFVNKNDYLSIGLENENFISYGYEDDERYERAVKLGLKVGRTDGDCWHIHHERDINSCEKNPNFEANKQEFERIKNMHSGELANEIKTWAWLKK